MPAAFRSVAKIWSGTWLPAAFGELGEGHRQRIGLLAGRAAEHPDAQRIVRAAGPCSRRGKTLLLQRLEGLRVAEEAGDADQDVLVQRLELGRVVAAGTATYSLQVVELLQHHAARDAAVERVELVVGEIDAGGAMQQLQDLGELRLARRARGRSGTRHRVGVPGDAHELARDLRRAAARRSTQPEAMALCGMPSCCARVVLGERDAALGLDRFEPERAVRRGAGQDHADGLVPLVLGQRAEELVDRPVQRRAALARQPAASFPPAMIRSRSGGIT